MNERLRFNAIGKQEFVSRVGGCILHWALTLLVHRRALQSQEITTLMHRVDPQWMTPFP